MTAASEKKSQAQKDIKAYRYRNFGLAQTSRKMRHEFRPLIHAIQPRVINIKDICAYLDLSSDSLAEHTGHMMLDTYFTSEDGFDILPLIRLIDHSPDFHVRLLEPPLEGTRKQPQAYYTGAAELIESYGSWNDIEFILDLQAIRLTAPTDDKTEQIIAFNIPPLNNSALKKSAKGSKLFAVHERVKYMNSLLRRSGPIGTRYKLVQIMVGNDEVTWKMGATKTKPMAIVTVWPEKDNDNVIFKPEGQRFKVRMLKDVGKDGWKFEIPSTRAT
jgi:hypothetical protein